MTHLFFIVVFLLLAVSIAGLLGKTGPSIRIGRKRNRRSGHRGKTRPAAPSRNRSPADRSSRDWDSVFAVLREGPRGTAEVSPIESAAERKRQKRAEANGKAGEKKLLRILRQGLDEERYEILSDIMLPDGRGGTTQIDFIVVSEFGVFVIEAKNFGSKISVDAEGQLWEKTLHDGTRSSFPSPIRQNKAHVRALEESTGIPESVMVPIVAFADRGEFETYIPAGVCFFSEVVPLIRSRMEPVIKAVQIPDIADAILAWNKSITPEQRAAHVAYLRARHGR